MANLYKVLLAKRLRVRWQLTFPSAAACCLAVSGVQSQYTNYSCTHYSELPLIYILCLHLGHSAGAFVQIDLQ